MNLILQRLVANAQHLLIAHPLRTEIRYLAEITCGLENHPFPANIIKKALVLLQFNEIPNSQIEK